MLQNKILFDIYSSVKFLDNHKMDKNREKINRIITKLNSKSYNQYNHYNHYGGTKESDKDYQEIMTNLDTIESGFLDYFKSLQGYINIYLKNAEQFENLLKDRLSIDSLKKLKDSINDLNVVLDKIK